MITTTATDIQNNFGKYLKAVHGFILSPQVNTSTAAYPYSGHV